MKVIHTNMVYTDGTRTVYAAAIVECRWIDRARGKWRGKHIDDTGARFETRGQELHSADAQTRCDELSRAEAARLELPAGPDVFPFARI